MATPSSVQLYKVRVHVVINKDKQRGPGRALLRAEAALFMRLFCGPCELSQNRQLNSALESHALALSILLKKTIG